MKITIWVLSLMIAFGNAGYSEGMEDGACSQDIQTHCAGVTPGEGHIAGCLHEHHENLSEPCKHSIEEKRTQRIEHRKKRRELRRKKRAISEAPAVTSPSAPAETK